ncbi:MAG: tRNA-dihydrouridine synthase family protein [Anaerolineales bacterium]|nr:tRNA-dihydrouridine synthase family protein [Anaerolineales bacterium]
MSAQSSPSFYVGDLPVYGEAILSPMDGFSDLPFRAMARRLGSAMSYSEFINAIDVMQGHPSVPQKIAYTAAERPMVFQLFDDDPARLLQAALRLRQHEPDIIDVNMGCSAKTVAGRGAGAGLLRQPAKVAQIFSTLSRALDIPVTGKMRLGWDDDSLNYLEIARIVQDNGGQLLAVHGRTKKQAYSGEANWEAIAEVKAALSIPVIGNGDVRTLADIARMRRFTGCDAVMIGRGAIGNPWIFAGLDREDVPAEQVRETMLAHLESMLEFYGAQRGLVLFRKHASRYISPFRLSVEQRQQLLTSQTAADFTRLVDQMSVAELAPA